MCFISTKTIVLTRIIQRSFCFEHNTVFHCLQTLALRIQRSPQKSYYLITQNYHLLSSLHPQLHQQDQLQYQQHQLCRSSQATIRRNGLQEDLQLQRQSLNGKKNRRIIKHLRFSKEKKGQRKQLIYTQLEALLEALL